MAADADQAPNKAHILVVDDEPTVREMVGLNLRADGYQVAFASDGNEALEVARTIHPDLIVLDVMLPGRNGLDVCRTLRGESSVPILLLSAKGEEIDRVLGLEIGADDYLAKPFAMRELVARVHAMLRRQQLAGVGEQSRFTPEVSSTADTPAGPGDTITAGDIVVSPSRHEAWIRGIPLKLTSKEFALLQYFVRHPGIVLSRDALLREVWEYDYPVGTRTVDVHIGWLRQKIEEDPANPQMILTVRGHGYRLVVPPETAVKDRT